MLGKQAKIVSPDTLRRMLDYTRQTRQPKRDAVIGAAVGQGWPQGLRNRRP